MSSIGVIGIGRLGLSFALLCERSGYRVFGYDNREDYVTSLVNKTYHTTEPFIDNYLQASRNFIPDVSLEEVCNECDIIYCFVATPSLDDGSYDHSAIDEVVGDIQELHVKGLSIQDKVLVIGCTVMPGYTNTIAGRLESSGMKVAYNPEFIAQGSIVDGLKYADMVLVGCTDESVQCSITAIYRTIMMTTPNIRFMSPTAAEITKISINCFLTTKITYANMIGEIAINSGIQEEIGTILKAIGDDSRIGHKYLGYGFGAGGVCLPRDQRALGTYMRSVGLVSLIPDIVDGTNNNHAVYLKNYFIRQNPDINIPFIFTQLSYKKGVDILTESQQYRLCKDLLETGYKVDITESPAVIEQVQQDLIQHKDRITYGGLLTGFNIDL